MRIVVFGNGPFAVPTLQALIAGDDPVVLVVARPDAPKGKRLTIEPGPVAQLAIHHHLRLEQPVDCNRPEFIAQLAEFAPDLFVVADFGQILAIDTLEAAVHGGINIHASLLPKYRGAAPIQWAIIEGEEETGVSIIQMNEQLDAGGILLQERVLIEPDETGGELETRLAQLGARLARDVIERLRNGRVEPLPQSTERASKAPRLNKRHGRINWTRSARAVHNQVRALIPWPIAYAEWLRRGDEIPLRFQVLKTRVIAERQTSTMEPGAILSAQGSELIVQAGEGSIALERVRPAGKRDMDAADFLHGHPIHPGDRLM